LWPILLPKGWRMGKSLSLPKICSFQWSIDNRDWMANGVEGEAFPAYGSGLDTDCSGWELHTQRT
jgi:hypothetical protein